MSKPTTMQQHGIIPSKPDEQGTPGLDGNDHGRLKSSSKKLKSGRPENLNQPKKDK